MAEFEKEPSFSESDNESVASSVSEKEEFDFEGGGEEEEDDDSRGEEEGEEDDRSVSEQENEKQEEVADALSISSSDSEEEDEEDDDYLQKLDEHVRSKVIENHHPELKTLNYEEVEALATVIRDKHNHIIDPLHQTLPIMTRYERARILGERARQINAGAKPFIEVEPTLIDGYLIALKELEQKRIPFIIQRPLPHGGSEYWRIADLE
jgi:DNA-directed RNA polymerase I, II, and III subunit RPABC2